MVERLNRGTHSLVLRFLAGCNIDNKETTFSNAIFCGLIAEDYTILIIRA
jgi:hypothetical protein